MKQSKYTVNISPIKQDRYKVQHLLEEICTRSNVLNYFGVFSVVVDKIIDFVYASQESDLSLKVDFRPCVGGLLCEVSCETAVFKSLLQNDSTNEEETSAEPENLHSFLSMLTNEWSCSEDGIRLATIFYITGIDAAYMIERSSSMETYFKSKRMVKQ